MASAIIIDIADVLTDEERNDQEAIALVRQIVATAGQRVSEEALRKAETFAINSFAPSPFEAMIFKLVNRDTTMALRCISAFRKNFNPTTNLRKDAGDILQACKQRGWRIATASRLSDEQSGALERARILQMIDVAGPPGAMKIELPDPRVLEFLVGTLGATPGDCIMLGTRLDNNIRPANMIRMTTIHLQQGRHGKHQLPRDLKDVPDYEAPDVQALLHVLPTVV
ncbi:MAG: HAD hydrolase-like protein [Planctomycetes bacterium]|nr:HAD hydrolase-like protein [Planctomycetota bacterium]